MTSIKIRTIWSSMAFLLLAACFNEEMEVPETIVTNNAFVGGKLASVQIAPDYEVNFWEIEPGNIVVDAYRSMEADIKAPVELKNILRGNKYVDMYRKLAGKNADLLSIKKLEQAVLRANDVEHGKGITAGGEGLFLETSDDIAFGEARTAAPVVPLPSCSRDKFNDQFGKDWFYTNYFVPYQPFLGVDDRLRNNKPNFYYTDANLNGGVYIYTWTIIVFNGDFSANNTFRVACKGSFNGTVGARKVRTFIIKPGHPGDLSGAYTNGLNCTAVHYYMMRE